MMEVQVQSGDKIHATKHLGPSSEILRFAQDDKYEMMRWLYTGDIGWRDEDGYVTVTDRKKEMIKFKGFSVAPAQIEALLLEHPAVADVAVIAKPDEEAGEVPKAYVVLREGYEQQSAGELMEWVNNKLATFKNVHEVEFIDSIPRNPSGKILRRILKEQDLNRLKLNRKYDSESSKRMLSSFCALIHSYHSFDH